MCIPTMSTEEPRTEVSTGNHNSDLALAVQKKQLRYYQNTTYKSSSTNLASAENWEEAQYYTFPGLWKCACPEASKVPWQRCQPHLFTGIFYREVAAIVFWVLAWTPTATPFPIAFPQCLHLADTTNHVNLYWMHPGMANQTEACLKRGVLER